MLSTRRSRRRSKVFRSRFDEASGNYPVRQYMRCREELYSSIVQIVLLSAFLIVLFLFTRTLWNVFDVHASALSPWYRRVVTVVMAVLLLIVGRRIWLKYRNIREVREEMRELKVLLADQNISRFK